MIISSRKPVLVALLTLGSATLNSACSSGAHHGAEPTGGADAPTSQAVARIDYDALFVVNGGESTISVIDTDANEVAATIQLKNASYPHHLYLSADGSKMILAVPGMDMSGGHDIDAHAGHGGAAMPGAVLLLDCATGKALRSRMLEQMNHNAIFSPDGSEIWTSQMMTPGAVLVLDASTLETLQSIDVGDQPAEVTFSADGSRAFVANGASGSVSVIDVASKNIETTITVGEGPVGAWQGSNGVAYVDNEAGKSLTAIDVTSLEVQHTYELGFMPGMAALGPDDQLWVTDVDNGRVVFYEQSTDTVAGEVATGAGAHAIAFHGNGATAYVSNQLDDSVSVIDVASQQVTATIAVGSKPNGLAWRSP